MIVLICFPVTATADSINGFMDLTYSNFSSKTTDSSGTSTKTESNSYFQRYNLMFEKTIFPKLRFDGGALFEKDVSKVNIDDIDTTSTNTRFRPFATLTLKDPIYTAGVGYYLKEATQKVSHLPSVKTVNEDYDSFFGWRPVGLPSLDLKYTKTNTYDTDRSILDVTKDYVSLISQYQYKGLDLRYFGTYVDTKDKLRNVETEDLTHNAMGTYATSFLNGRAAFSTSYNLVREEVTSQRIRPREHSGLPF